MDNLYIVIFKTSLSILGYRPSEYKLHSFISELIHITLIPSLPGQSLRKAI